MLILTRRVGESIVIDGRVLVTVVVIGADFVDLSIADRCERSTRIVTLADRKPSEIAGGVRGTFVCIADSNEEVRLGFDIPPGVTVEREEFLDELVAWQELRDEAMWSFDPSNLA